MEKINLDELGILEKTFIRYKEEIKQEKEKRKKDIVIRELMDMCRVIGNNEEHREICSDIIKRIHKLVDFLDNENI